MQKLAPEIETIKQFYAALNTDDVSAAIKLFDAQIVRVEFEGTPSGSTVRGVAEMKEHIIKGRSTWAEGACTPERFLVSGDKIVVFVHVRVRLKNKTEWNEGRIADTFIVKKGLITEMRSFMSRQEALDWAGIKD